MLTTTRPAFQPTMPRFGCRQMAFMTDGNEATPAQQKMLRELLVDNPNSLKEQSKKRNHPHRDGKKTPLHEEDLLNAPKKGNPDGWGIATYSARDNNTLKLERSLINASQDTRFDTASDTLVKKAPQTLMAHILNKVDPNRILANEEDVHPFYLENWSGMFNGVLDGGRTPVIIDAVNNTHCPTLGCTMKGTNTGEKFLLYFLGKLKQQFGLIDSQRINLEKLQQAFAETARDFLKLSQPVYRKLDGSVSGLKGKVQLGPSLNYILTDGKVLMAHRKGRKLYVNRHEATNGNFGYLVSSEPVQPKKGKKLSWLELPQDHILTLAKNAQGKIEPTLTPVSTLLS